MTDNELKLKIWRVHPTGCKIIPAEKTLNNTANPSGVKWCGPYTYANKLGWWLFSPVDIDICWKGGREFDSRILTPYDDSDYHLIRSLIKPSDYVDPDKWSPVGGRTKFTWGAVEEGIIQIWTGCVTGETRILTESGFLTIKELIKKNNKLILTEFGINSFLSIKDQGIKETLRIKTSLQNEITVSKDHQFKVLSNTGIEWKYASDLHEGDYILCKKGHDNLIPLSRGGDTELWYILGHLFGDGCMSSKGRLTWIFPENENETKERVESFLKKHNISFSYYLKINPKNNKLCWYLYSDLAKNKLSKYLPRYLPKGKWRKPGLLKHVWKLGEKQLSSFLSALFTTDGSIDKTSGRPVFCTKHYNVAKDTKQLLQLFGIISSIAYIEKETEFGFSKCFYVRLIGSESISIFTEKINFGLEYKRFRLKEYKKEAHNERIIGFPNIFNIIKTIFPSQQGVRLRRPPLLNATIKQLRRGRTKLITANILKQIIELAKKENRNPYYINLFTQYLENNWWFDKVKTIKTGRARRVYDIIDVEKTNSYCANGFVSHNCIFSTSPGWGLLLRDPINFTDVLSRNFHIQEGVIESDWLGYDIWMNLVFTKPNEWIQLRRNAYPPLAQICPIRKDAYDNKWQMEEEIINRNSEDANKLFEYWIQYNHKKFGNGGKQYLTPDGSLTKNGTTYHKERLLVKKLEEEQKKILGKDMEPKPRIKKYKLFKKS